MLLRAFVQEDAKQCAQLFYDTIHKVNSKDYNQKQINAWAPKVDNRVIDKLLKLALDASCCHCLYTFCYQVWIKIDGAYVFILI